MDENNEEDIIFAIKIKDLQGEAIQRIGRKLTEEELYQASKGIESGLSFGLDIIFKTAIEEAIET